MSGTYKDVRSTQTAPHTEQSCRPVREVLNLVGDKWSVLIVGILAGGSKRFTEIQNSIDGISQRMLTRTLRELERTGLITRTVKATVPLSVHYALTARGETLLEPVKGLATWAQENYAGIEESKKRYDKKKPSDA